MSDSATAASQQTAAAIEELLTGAERALQRATKPTLAWFDAQQMSPLRWKTGERVPPVALNYLLLCQMQRGSSTRITEPTKMMLALVDMTASNTADSPSLLARIMSVYCA